MNATPRTQTRVFRAVLAWLLLAGPCLAQIGPPGVTNTFDTNTSPGTYTIVERGPSHKVFQRTLLQTNAFNGRVHARTNSYTELSTASSRLVDGTWVDTSEQIAVTANGAQATNGYHSLQFLGNLNASGSISLTTPEGKRLVSNILGLSYWDYSTTNSVWIATTKDSFGQLLPSGDRALFPDAFNGLSCDVLYLNTRSKFEQLVIVKQQIPDPASFHMNPETTLLQIVTEFSNPPPPEITQTQTATGPDDNLNFGIMQMPRGFAFASGSETNKIRVTKRWVTIDQRTCLFEQIPFTSIQPLLAQLPPPPTHGSVEPDPNSILYRVASRPVLPPRKLVLNRTPSLLLAKAAPELKGLVADYSFVTSQTNFTFKAGQTYFVTNYGINLSGTTTLEAAVIKFSSNTNNWPTVTVYGPFRCLTTPYQMAVLTSQDDDSVGDQITGSTGSPVIRNAFCFDAEGPGTSGLDWNIKYIRCSYAQAAFAAYDGLDLTARHCQFVNCVVGIGALAYSGPAANVTVQNCLFDRCAYPVYCDGKIRAVNVTAVGYTNFCQSEAGILSLAVTNSIMVGAGWAGSDSSTTNLPSPTLDHSTVAASSAGLFQSAGAGNFYLVDNSTNRNSGTRNIDFLSDLARKTTYPPVVANSGPLTNTTVLWPTAQRDTDAPDIGFEYDPLDVLFSGNDINATTLTVQPGTAIGILTTGSGFGAYGLGVRVGSSLQAQGSALAPIIFADANTVQEQSPPSAGELVMTEWNNISSSASASFRFTKWYALGSGPFLFSGEADDGGNITVGFHSSEFYSGSFHNATPALSLTNSLFERVAVAFDDDGPSLSVYNCLFHGGSCTVNRLSATWIFQNNAFDRCTISHPGPPTTYDHNAYIAVTNYLGSSLQTGDLSLTNLAWVAGPLGNFYQPSTSSLCNTGSTTADLLTLFHYTVTTNFLSSNLQIRETNSIVDMSYHLVSVGTNGLPISTSGDGWGDYFLDVNGNGNACDDALSCTNYNSPNGLTSANGLHVFTPLK